MSHRQAFSVSAAAYGETPPWDVGQPQPAWLALLDESPPAGPALDVGCGTGELEPALAGRGLSVLGVDLAAAAIEKVRAVGADELRAVFTRAHGWRVLALRAALFATLAAG